MAAGARGDFLQVRPLFFGFLLGLYFFLFRLEIRETMWYIIVTFISF